LPTGQNQPAGRTIHNLSVIFAEINLEATQGASSADSLHGNTLQQAMHRRRLATARGEN